MLLSELLARHVDRNVTILSALGLGVQSASVRERQLADALFTWRSLIERPQLE